MDKQTLIELRDKWRQDLKVLIQTEENAHKMKEESSCEKSMKEATLNHAIGVVTGFRKALDDLEEFIETL